LVNTVAIVGSGVIGRGIAVACAMKDFKMKMIDVNKSALVEAAKATSRILSTIEEVQPNLVPKDALRRISFQMDYASGLESVQLAIESVAEDLELKKKVFARLDSIADASVVLATNTSGLSITKIASVTKRPGSVVGIHFFAPAYILKAVEIVRGKKTSERTLRFARRFAEALGKVPVIVQKDTKNFLINSIQFAMIKEARRLLGKGVVSSMSDIDKAIEHSFPVRQSLFGLFLDSDLISPYSAVTHPARRDFTSNYNYENPPEELMGIRDESLLKLMSSLEKIRRAGPKRIRVSPVS